MLRLNNEMREQKTFGCLKSAHLTYQLAKFKNTIGRSESCNIIINHPSISKEHAIIEYDPHKNIVVINDLASSNGTFVNGNKLTSSAYLHQNDLIRFGKDDTEYCFDFYYQLPCLNDNFSFSDSGPNKQNDKKISLVNDNNYNYAQVNHLSPRGNKGNGIQEQHQYSRDDNNKFIHNINWNSINNNAYSSNENNFHNDSNDIKDPLFEEISKQRSHLSDLLKQKTIELDNEKKNASELKTQYNQLQSRYNELKIFSTEFKKRNETLELELKFSNNKALSSKNHDVNAKLIKEKDQIISILQDELKFLKEKSPLYHSSNATDKLNENKYLNNKIDELIAKFNKENGLNLWKNNELIKTNEMLNDTIKTMIKDKTALSLEYQSIISSYDKRLLDSLSKYPKSFDANAKKEEAAKYLVEQIEEYLKEKERIVNENIALKNDLSVIKTENTQLKSELNKQKNTEDNSNSKTNKNTNAENELYNVIQRQIDQKINEINELKAKLKKKQSSQSFKNSNNTIDDEKLLNEITSALNKQSK